MKILDYCTRSGKNVILSYIDNLPAKERLELYIDIALKRAKREGII